MIGKLQLLRKLVVRQINFAAKVECAQYASCLETVNQSVLKNIVETKENAQHPSWHVITQISLPLTSRTSSIVLAKLWLTRALGSTSSRPPSKRRRKNKQTRSFVTS